MLEDVPDDLKGKDDTKGEASLKGHLMNGGTADEKQGSQAYVPPDQKNDNQLTAALNLLRGITTKASTAGDTPKPADPPKASSAADTPKVPQPN